MQKNNLHRGNKGLYKDSSYIDQPKDTYTFALNAINETELGDNNFLSNEESNEICASLTAGFVPIGKVYMPENQTIIFSVSETSNISEIGILDDACNYVVHVNDELSSEEDKLNFKVTHQIQGTYRLRLGCERTVYWVDGNNNRPRYFNFDSPQNFKNNDVNSTWNADLFNLQKSYSNIPKFQTINVLDSGGNLEPGSYNVAIQYVDESLNPTEWITTSKTIKIYNDLSIEEYRDIEGSINSDSDYENYPATSKAIEIIMSNLDTDFLYYRLAFIEANNGSGLISAIKLSEAIPTSKNNFIYTGSNVVGESTTEEIAQFTNTIYKAGSIEQIENTLVLGNVQGKQVNFCNLQKYASKIKADCIVKKVVLNDLKDVSNPKNPTYELGGTGYMPGELYSFGIIYVFSDGSTTPVYHIPGKAPGLDQTMVFSYETRLEDDGFGNNIEVPITFGMRCEENITDTLVNQGTSTYFDNETCGTGDYWGRDSEGVLLSGKLIRHHRFPLRTDIQKPLVITEEGTEKNSFFYNLILRIQGELKTDPESSFEIRVIYTVGGQEFELSDIIDSNFYKDTTINDYTLDEFSSSQNHGSNDFSIVEIQIQDSNGDFQTISSGSFTATYTNNYGVYFTGDATITCTTEENIATVKDRNITTEILGIKFSNIDVPTVEETNGEQIIGYYIVRNERTEFNKTILDTGVMTPSLVNNKYISHGLLQPQVADTNKISSSVYGLIHPEHKFKGKEYFSYDQIIQQGNFNVTERKFGKVLYNDVYDGSSYNSSKQSGGNDDGWDADNEPLTRGYDGWSLNILSRDNIVSFETKNDFNLSNTDIKDRFYLKALENRSINDLTNDVYNISTDNKVGIINLENGVTLPANNNLPYVVLKKNTTDVYSNFRVLPYYRDTQNIILFDSPNQINDTTSVFGGDSYVSPMRYVNTCFWDNRVAKRKGKSSGWKKFLGGLLLIIGSILLPGAGTALAIGASIAIIGAGALFVASGIETDNYNKAYNEEYDKGLRETALDDWVDAFYNYKNNTYTNPGDGTFGFTGGGGLLGSLKYGKDGPSDDTIQWIGDCITDLWFDTSINTSLRTGMVSDTPTFLNFPGKIESGNNTVLRLLSYKGLDWIEGNSERYPVSSLERHLAKKLLAFDGERNDNRFYIGIALGEYYKINPDYERTEKEKIYTHLPLEYDCCSECQEKFPNRIHYSEQSFQEELSDNFRVFLPNNYRDIPGETGEISNIFKIGNNLFIHSYEGLWQQPRNYQERVTDQIVSFIGAGDYFSIPPQKVVDDDTGSTAGLQHKWSAIKTPYGYFFVCENQRKIYQFNGRNLKPISSIGLENWFKENGGINLFVDKDYYSNKAEKYLLRDNPSNRFGSGFISTYDTKKERMIFTKKDFKYASSIIDVPDSKICYNNGQLTLFQNYQQTIDTEIASGWNFVGIEDCRMKFEKINLAVNQEERQISNGVIDNTTDIHVFYDYSGSFGNGTLPPGSYPYTGTDPVNELGADLASIDSAINTWITDFAAQNSNWTGTLYKYVDGTERWVNYPENLTSVGYPYENIDISTKNILVISFCNESLPVYYEGAMTSSIDNPTSSYLDDYDKFTGSNIGGNNNLGLNLYSSYKSFIGINYPILFSSISASIKFLQHSLAALKGDSYTPSEISNLLPNPVLSPTEQTTLETSLLGSNPYPNGLENFGWQIKENRFNDNGTIITAEQFQQDIEELLASTPTIGTILVDVITEEKETKFIDGISVNTETAIASSYSWTMSYALEQNDRKEHWVSWHSYLPNFYINVPEKFYSWIHGNNNIWKHNVKGVYQTFYGTFYPHIIEYISLSTPIQTRVWNFLRLLTEAKKYNSNLLQYVDDRFTTFNKAVFYNTRQCSGEINLIPKDTQANQQNYLSNQVTNLGTNTFIIDRNERDWTMNDLRDIRVDYLNPIWNANKDTFQNEYFIDKVLNDGTLNINKDWSQLENFTDKYLVIRLIFDSFADVKLITNYSVENEQQSFR